jgi:hypothetical protein
VAVIPGLQPIIKRNVNLADIHADYDNLLRIAAPSGSTVPTGEA